jgi:hypothetical protein
MQERKYTHQELLVGLYHLSRLAPDERGEGF